MESKSTIADTAHEKNIKLAYSHLEAKVSGKNTNSDGEPISPWASALNHARQVESSDKILDEIKALSKEFIGGIYHNIGEFNIIPASTVFLDGSWQLLDSDEIFEKISSCMDKKKFKNLHVVCVTKRTVDLFLDYLNS